MNSFESLQFGLLAEGWFELILPIFIFGIYIIGALAKNWTQQQKQDPEEHDQSELKKAVRKRYEQIRQRQMGEGTPQLKKTPKAIPAARTLRQEENRPRQISQWEQQQQVIRQRNAKLQEQRMAARQTRAVQAQKPVVRYARTKPPKMTRQVPVPSPVQAQMKKAAKKKPVSKKVEQAPRRQPTGNLLSHMINRPENLKSAIIVKEILDKPLALRGI
ncbi:MAG: hypothetical protein ABFR90_04600 [Planctomycetota bacterium]